MFTLFCKKDPRNDESTVRFVLRTQKLRKECEINRSETCFKGLGIGLMTEQDLNPNPVKTAEMQKQKFW